MERVLVTGAAGFIGFHLTRKLIDQGFEVIGIDNMNDYYDVGLKEDRLKELEVLEGFTFMKIDLKEKEKIDGLFLSKRPDYVVNLAAQAGVRYSLENPYAYIDSNIVGFMSLLEACRHFPVKHLLYASSSSVYGGNDKVPFSTEDKVDFPVSLYAATKKSNELLAHSYSHLYSIPSTGLRFFTVYGPWGRPDMAYFLFTDAIVEGKPIKVFNHGKMERDFTYVDDIVDGVSKLLMMPPEPGSSEGTTAPYQVYNIGNSSPVQLETFISTLEDKLGLEAEKVYMDMQPGDVLRTYAEVDPLERKTGFKPVTDLSTGLGHFVEWYKAYYGI